MKDRLMSNCPFLPSERRESPLITRIDQSGTMYFLANASSGAYD